MAERVRFAPQGLFGGGAARSNHYIRDPEGAAIRYPSKFSVDLAAGEVMSIQSGRRRRLRRRSRRATPRSSAPTSRPGGSARTRARDVYGARSSRRPRTSERVPRRRSTSAAPSPTSSWSTRRSRQRWTGKVLSTPDDPVRGLLPRARPGASTEAGVDDRRLPVRAPCDDRRDERGHHPDRRSGRAHRTEGFRDVLEIARQIRHELYDLRTTKPRAARAARVGARGPRAASRSTARCIVPLDEDSVRRAAAPAARARASGRSRSASSTPTSTRSTSERVAEILREEVPGHLDLALERDRARDPRVPAGQHDRRERLRRAGRRRATSRRSRTACATAARAPGCG